MTGAVAVVCRPSLTPGFWLAGVEAISARDGAEAAARIGELAERPDVGLVLVEESLQEEVGAVGTEAFRREGLPLVLPFPGPIWEAPEEPEARVLELLRRAVGYRVRLG